MLNFIVQNLITLQADGIEVMLCFEVSVNIGISKGCIATEESGDVIGSVTIDNRLKWSKVG